MNKMYFFSCFTYVYKFSATYRLVRYYNKTLRLKKYKTYLLFPDKNIILKKYINKMGLISRFTFV